MDSYNKSKDTTKTKISWGFLMVFSQAIICLISLLMIVLIIIFHFNSTPYEIIGEIVKEWRQGPIYNLTLGVQPYLFINDAFEGTVGGCTCPLTKESATRYYQFALFPIGLGIVLILDVQ